MQPDVIVLGAINVQVFYSIYHLPFPLILTFTIYNPNRGAFIPNCIYTPCSHVDH